jgi:uncharacterized membrane protein YciS (DUF1049 family)
LKTKDRHSLFCIASLFATVCFGGNALLVLLCTISFTNLKLNW